MSKLYAQGWWQRLENTLKHTNGAYGLVLALAVLLFFIGLGSAPVYILDEAKNAQCAREMLLHHNYIVPTFNGELRTDKPVFHYWMMILAYNVFGISPFSARFFSAVAGVLLVGYTYRFARVVYNKQTAFWGCIFLLSALHLSLEMHFAVPDPYFIFFVVAAVFEYYFFYRGGKINDLLLSYVWVALGVLSKGPAAILLVGGIIFFHLLLSKTFTWQRIKQLRLLLGIVIILVIAAPWYLAVDYQTHGLWTKGFFLEHNVGRFTAVKEGHGGFFLLAVIFVIVGLLPFAVWLVPALFTMVRRKTYNPDDLLLLVAAGFITLFFTASQTKLPNYTMPAYPFLALLLARHWVGQPATQFKEKAQWIVYTVIMLLLPIAVYVAVAIEPAIQSLSAVALLFLLLPIGAVVGGMLNKHGLVWGSRLAVAMSFWVTILLFNLFAFPIIYSRNPVQQALAATGNMQQYVAFRSYNPGFNFYLPAAIPVLQDSITLAKYLQQHPDAFVLTRREDLPAMGKQPLTIVSEGKDIFELPVTVVLRPAETGEAITIQ